MRLFSLQTRPTPGWWAIVPAHWWSDQHAEAALFLLLLALLTQRPCTPEGGQTEPLASRLLRLALEDYEGMVSQLLPEAGTTDAEREAGRETLETLTRLVVERLRDASTGEVPGSGAAERVLTAYQHGFQTLGYPSGGDLWRELLRRAGQDISEVIARIPLTSSTVAIGFDEVSPRLRRTYLGTAHAGRDVALFDRLLREAFEGGGGVVCWNCDDEWVVFTGAGGAEARVRAVAASFAEMTPFTFDGTYTVLGAGGEERAARVTGAGRCERAFRCVMDRLGPGEEPEHHRYRVQNLYMEDNSGAPLNTLVWKDDLRGATTVNRDAHRVEWLSASRLSCPFCRSPVRDEGRPICGEAVCPVCRAHFRADFRLE
ncbi:hypothetical protein R5W24_005332 [Gemmata sp. JC717]|uniref:hypothetical protein n=1 Tax=Gemmata algarum TaxID=2975278 RepID=UPI0021BB8F74|nr:hypothetical protein [Gemmata algarum]MDY3556169.1 hypothetical protein [Gemmata algarum]